MVDKICPVMSVKGAVFCERERCMWYFDSDCAVSYLVSMVARLDSIERRMLGKGGLGENN
jgi:hypothetical protein